MPRQSFARSRELLNCVLPLDNEIDLAGLEGLKAGKSITSNFTRSFRLPRWARSDRARFQTHNTVSTSSKELDEKVESSLRNKQITSASRLKALSKVGTTVIKIQGSAEGVIACSVSDTLPDRALMPGSSRTRAPTNLKTQETPRTPYSPSAPCRHAQRLYIWWPLRPSCPRLTFSPPQRVTSTSSFLDRMKKNKYNPIVGNIGHFDNEINLARL